MEGAVMRLRCARIRSRTIRHAVDGDRKQDGRGLQDAPVRIVLRREELRGSRRFGGPCGRRRRGHARGRLRSEPGLYRQNQQEGETCPGSQRPHETGPQTH